MGEPERKKFSAPAESEQVHATSTLLFSPGPLRRTWCPLTQVRAATLTGTHRQVMFHQLPGHLLSPVKFTHENDLWELQKTATATRATGSPKSMLGHQKKHIDGRGWNLFGNMMHLSKAHVPPNDGRPLELIGRDGDIGGCQETLKAGDVTGTCAPHPQDLKRDISVSWWMVESLSHE